MFFDENPFTYQCKKGQKGLSGPVQIFHFNWSFSSDVIAVRGLTSDGAAAAAGPAVKAEHTEERSQSDDCNYRLC